VADAAPALVCAWRTRHRAEPVGVPTHSDFALGQADLDIRYGVPRWPDLVVEPLFEEAILPLASPAFIRAHRLKRVEQLLEVPLIQSTVSVVQWSDWFGLFSDKRAPERFRGAL
jgi:DNA-binding transcriptional LysR family regulator